MKLSDNAIHLLKERYCNNGEKPEDVFDRVAKALSENEKEYKEFKSVMENLEFLPNSPCLMNANSKTGGMLKACFTLKILDSMESIFESLWKMAVIFKASGGVGFNFSKLREKGATVSRGGTSSGVVEFLKLYDVVVEVVKQGGKRRGAAIGILDYFHPEILDFITEKLKGGLKNFNLSVAITDEFMEKVINNKFIYLQSPKGDKKIQKINANDLFNFICLSSWKIGEPGILFFDTINKDNPYEEQIEAVNPCGEAPLFFGESCCLGSINLTKCLTSNNKLSLTKLRKVIKIGTKMLLKINKFTTLPFDELYTAQSKYNRIGLGVMGFADMLVKMGIYYDSEEALKIIDIIGKEMRTIAKRMSPMSASVLSIAPTGSLCILADCSSGIEPPFSEDYVKKLTIGDIRETRKYNKFIKTAHEISPEWHLKILAQWQKYVDGGVSKSVNVSNNTTVNDIKDIFMLAWKLNCKGVTIYRDTGEGAYQNIKCDDENCTL